VAAALLWVCSFLFSLATLDLLNDHFHRISSARQIVVYADIPFRDFLDPGFFLTELASAALQRLLGDNLLGEALLVTASIATGTVFVFLLARRLSQSAVLAAIVALVALACAPRAYDFDKVLFYPLGLLLCWRYAERPGAGRLSALAAGAAAAGLFRYDSGVYIVAVAVVTIAVVHAPVWKAMVRRTALLGCFISVCLAPAAVFIQVNGGIANAADQMVAYARREAARTELARQRFVHEESWLTRANASVFLYYFLRTLPLACAFLMIVRVRRNGDTSRLEIARVATLVTMSVLLNLFILRDPVSARVGGMAGSFAVLSAWLVQRAWLTRSVVARGSAALVLAAAVWSVFAVANWPPRLARGRLTPSVVFSTIERLAASPPRYETMPSSRYVQMVQYLRECTSPRDRVLLAWFAPDVYFFAQRGFAAGMAAVFGAHWSEPRFEERSLRIFAAQSVPIVIVRATDESFERSYPLTARYLHDHYHAAGTTDFGDPDIDAGGYEVLIRNDRAPTRRHAPTSMPCFW